eukprot:5113103-Amphidinium_carterae.1
MARKSLTKNFLDCKFSSRCTRPRYLKIGKPVVVNYEQTAAQSQGTHKLEGAVSVAVSNTSHKKEGLTPQNNSYRNESNHQPE